MKLTIALIATAAITALAASTPKEPRSVEQSYNPSATVSTTPQWEPIAPDVLARFARDTTHAHQLDSVARVQVQAAQAIRQNALQNLGEDIHYVQGDSVDLGRGIIKRSAPEKSKKTPP